MGTLKHLSLYGSLITLASLAACAPMARDVPHRASFNVPQSFRASTKTPVMSQPVGNAWWLKLGDAKLDDLVARALDANTDVLIALTRVEEARANEKLAGSQLLPSFSADVAGGSSRSLSEVTGKPIHQTAIEADLGATWEADLWGRVRNLNDMTAFSYLSVQDQSSAVRLVVAAATTRAYIRLLSLDSQLEITRETLMSRQAALTLAEDRARNGYVASYEVTQARSEYESIAQSVSRLEQSVAQQQTMLCRLIGDPTHAIDRGKLADINLPPLPEAVPADVLRRRPDLAAAEAAIASADANLASKRAEFMPAIRLTPRAGELFVDSLKYDPVTVFSLGGSVLDPIFSAGRLNAQLDAATAQRDRAAYAYKAAVLSAFGDIEVDLSNETSLASQTELALRRQDILHTSVAQAKDRYQAGYANYLEELDAQRNLYSAQTDVIVLRETRLNNMVSLFEALGGGWDNP